MLINWEKPRPPQGSDLANVFKRSRQMYPVMDGVSPYLLDRMYLEENNLLNEIGQAYFRSALDYLAGWRGSKIISGPAKLSLVQLQNHKLEIVLANGNITSVLHNLGAPINRYDDLSREKSVVLAQEKRQGFEIVRSQRIVLDTGYLLDASANTVDAVGETVRVASLVGAAAEQKNLWGYGKAIRYLAFSNQAHYLRQELERDPDLQMSEESASLIDSITEENFREINNYVAALQRGDGSALAQRDTDHLLFKK